jgi:hybrid cluster-associated redox disulfide protein
MFRKEMSIMEALQMHPKSREVFKKHGMACLSCMGAMEESIQVGADMHGIEIELLMKELNDLVKQGT